MTMPRRNLLRLFGVSLGASLVAATAPPAAWAERERFRVLDGAGPEPTLGPPQTAPELQRLARTLRVGAAGRRGALTVLWLHGHDVAGLPPMQTLDEARTAGSLLVTERDRAAVPEVVVDNRGKTHVLLLAGEILVGGKQNRVLREDLLLPPLSGPRLVGVYCVEQGRWNEGRRDFDSKASFAQPSLRREVVGQADQARVWSEVARSARIAAAPSPTGSYQQVYDKPEVQAHLAEAERGLVAPAAERTVGAAVYVHDRFTGLDAFADPGLFARAWPKLLRAHAVEAYGRAAGPDVLEDKLRSRVQSLLAAIGDAPVTARANVGVGRLLELRLGAERGAALAFEGRVVHLAVL
jgi:hypothetical protein